MAVTKPIRKSKPSRNGPPAPEVLTLAEAAKFLRVTEAGLLTDAVAGRVPARRVAGEWRFGRARLLAWLGDGQPLVSPKDRIRAVIGTWADDPTVDPMLERIARQRAED